MLILKSLDFVELCCTDGCLVREELAKFVEGDNLLIFLELLMLIALLLYDVLLQRVSTWTDFIDAVANTFDECAALEARTR